MPDEKLYTARDLILAKREAYAEVLHATTGWSREGAERKAAARYPLPKITQPRVKTDSRGAEFRVNENGGIEGRNPRWREGALWGQFESWEITPERVALWADLLANPTEEVDDAD